MVCLSSYNNYMKKYFLPLITIILLAACNDVQQNKRTVMVSIEPLRFLTEEIAGDRFHVTTMVPEGMSPETYEPTAQQMIQLAQSDMYIKVGSIGFEQAWMKRMEANAPHTLIINASEGIKPIKSSGGHEDPHTWMSANNAMLMAHNICRALTAIDHRDSTYFEERKEKLCEKIRNTDLKVRKQLTKDKKTVFLIYHPTLTYFAHDYALKQIAIEEEGREPSSAQTLNVIRQAKKEGVKVLFVQRQFNIKNTRAVSNAVGATSVQIDPLNYHWCEEMTHVAESLK